MLACSEIAHPERPISLYLASDLPHSRRIAHHTRADRELALHEDDRARQPHNVAMLLDELASPHRADELDNQFDGGVRLVRVGPQCGHAHGLIGKRREHAAMHDIEEVQILRFDEEAEPRVAMAPDRAGEVAKARLLDDFPPGLRRIEWRR